MSGMGRRELVALLGGAAAWPLTARGQQGERMRRIGVLIGLEETDTEVGKYLSELRKTLRALGWIEGKNLWIDHRAALDLDGMRLHALDLVNLGAELVVTLRPLQPTQSGRRQWACRSCSHLFPIRSARVLWRASRGPAA